MYQTSKGERTLTGAERQLFEASLGMMVDLLHVQDMDFGVQSFDNLQRGQKLFALYQVGRGLLNPSEPAPRLTAYLEATVAAIYYFALDQVEQEIACTESPDESTYWRSLALQAASEAGEMDELPSASCSEKDEWEIVLESLEGAVLWDRDFELQVGMDVAPEQAESWKSQLGIDGDYFTAVPFDVPGAQYNLYLDALKGLTPKGRA